MCVLIEESVTACMTITLQEQVALNYIFLQNTGVLFAKVRTHFPTQPSCYDNTSPPHPPSPAAPMLLSRLPPLLSGWVTPLLNGPRSGCLCRNEREGNAYVVFTRLDDLLLSYLYQVRHLVDAENKCLYGK